MHSILAEAVKNKLLTHRAISQGGGGLLPYITYTGMCAQRGHDFEAPDLEWGIHFSGIF